MGNECSGRGTTGNASLPHHATLARRLPTTPEECSSPLHVTRVSRMCYTKILNMILPERQKRQEELWDLLRDFPRSSLDYPRRGSTLPSSDTQLLLGADIIEPFIPDGSPPVIASAFTVVEEKHGKLRRRFILWPQQNSMHGFMVHTHDVPQLELDHGSCEAVHAACGGVTDLTTSFFQIELPPHLRSLFCLTDERGSIFQLKALPTRDAALVQRSCST